MGCGDSMWLAIMSAMSGGARVHDSLGTAEAPAIYGRKTATTGVATLEERSDGQHRAARAP